VSRPPAHPAKAREVLSGELRLMRRRSKERFVEAICIRSLLPIAWDDAARLPGCVSPSRAEAYRVGKLLPNKRRFG
jgi:hypothetical protein